MFNRRMFVIIAFSLIVIGVLGAWFTFPISITSAPFKVDKVISGKPIDTILFDSTEANLTIVPTDHSDIQLSLRGKGDKFNEKQFVVNTSDSTLKVTFQIEDSKWYDFYTWEQTPSLHVQLPKKIYQSLYIKNHNGSIEVTQQQIKEMNIHAANGAIIFKQIESSQIETSSVNGQIQMQNVTGNINGETVNGEIDLALSDLNRTLTLSSENGSILVKTKQKPVNNTIHAQTVNGRINLFDQYTGSAFFGEGDHRVQLKTTNGSIDVLQE
ncbi:DUF4097 family beta strand repeat protein [Hazenella sp. IB182353]|uniref:DUF4097 family beta strand repeat-containing protein n=1 Tax=Polycladospora coralii TaxID=2771432 RepID=UPI001745E93B|nr:DUF4097 family beta strand repeat-containing protein [Polycladospora coralii]MBS7530028.1 DUF4097 family beta strand repeat protein [Polycladospora coralii]